MNTHILYVLEENTHNEGYLCLDLPKLQVKETLYEFSITKRHAKMVVLINKKSELHNPYDII
jgi:hypothetical protein